ncbi:hypothetical protein F5X98DRAFT_258266 [Xylaria grammica]|nr:hypothetical protein F5X98DRAFT_258266 [Xylaria grammica]
MSNPRTTQAQETGISFYSLASRSASSAITLSSGAIAAITIVGSVLLFLVIVGPLLVHLAKRQNRHREAACAVSNLSLAEHGHLVQDGDINAPRRLRKKSAASERTSPFDMKDTESEGREGELTKHLSLPILPSVFSRPGIWRISGPLSGETSWDGGAGDRNGNAGGGGPQSRIDSNIHGEQMYGSPEKHRGYTIYQNRRKTSWIDEDALHGPRVSPKKNTKRKTGWFTGNELTRTLSRHLSFHKFGGPELARSPTLPCIETGQERESVDGMPEQPLENIKKRNTENPYGSRESEAEIEIEPRFPVRQPLQQGGSLNTRPRPMPLSIPNAAPPNPYRHSHTAVNATHQLAGQARVPSVEAGVKAQRHSRLQQSNTDAELQAILRRTADELEDGSRSARRQTLMLPTPSSPPKRLDQARREPSQEWGYDQDYTRPGDMTPSPAKSQKSAPAAVMYSELEGCSPKVQQGPSQNGTPWQKHQRTHTRQISLFPKVSMFPGSNSVTATPSTRSPQTDKPHHKVLSSPSRMAQASPSYSQHGLGSRSYSPASQQSSALSTVYSEDEGSPPTDDSVLEGTSEIERQAMAQALQACDAFDGGQTRRAGNSRNDEGNLELQGIFQTIRDPHIRKRARGETLSNTVRDASVSVSIHQDNIKQPAARTPPRATSTFTFQTAEATREDPFTTYVTPTRQKPQRLSQVFSPLPAELPGDSIDPINSMMPISETPTPSPSRRCVVPPPHRLRPATSSPTLGQYHDARPQIQPPSREPSPAVSESGLSSVYDSYRYSRYSDSVEGSQTLARLSGATILAAPPVEPPPPTKTKWDEDMILPASAKSDKDYRGIESANVASRPERVSLNNAMLGAGAYTHLVGTFDSSGVEDGSLQREYTMEDRLPRSQPIRDISLGDASNSSGESTYSQDGDGRDKLGPLMPFHTARKVSGKHTMGVTSTVAELRRMNSQLSCVSGYSTTTTVIAGDVSPTLPALRGGGFSPGKKGAGSGAKNYLSLGSSPTSKTGEDEESHVQSKRYDAGCATNGNEHNEDKMMPVGITEDTVTTRRRGTKDGITIRRGGLGRSRRGTIVQSYEHDLDRARQVYRDSRGYTLQAIMEVSKESVGHRDLITHAAKLPQEEERKSLAALELYDNKGFLRSSMASQDSVNYV